MICQRGIHQVIDPQKVYSIDDDTVTKAYKSMHIYSLMNWLYGCTCRDDYHIDKMVYRLSIAIDPKV